MGASSDTRVPLRWAFLGLGLFLIFRAQFVVQSVLRADAWARWFFPNDFRRYAYVMAAAYLFLIPAGLMCLATAWGLKRGLRWSRWCGIATCVLLLAGFPWLTLAGAAGLLILFKRPPQIGAGSGRPTSAKASADYWTRKKQSVLQPILAFVLLIPVFDAMGWFVTYGRRHGLSEWRTGGYGLAYLVCFFLMQTVLHELGHTAMAWALHFEVEVISAGPFKLYRDRLGWHFRFDWKLLLQSGGYTGATPRSDRNLRLKQIAVVAAGPAASLLTGLTLLAASFWIVEMHWYAFWPLVVNNALLGFYYAAVNLMPVGYSDGTMLWHLILWSRRGRELISRSVLARFYADAKEFHYQADFDREIEIRQQALRLAQIELRESPLMIAVCHQWLGHAYLAAEDWHAAESEFRKTLSFEQECAAQPGLAANAWSGAVRACSQREDARGTAQAYDPAVAIIERRTKDRDNAECTISHSMLADVHIQANRAALGLEQAVAGLRQAGKSAAYHLIRGKLHGARALCELQLRHRDDGLGSARNAAAAFRAAAAQPAHRNLAWEDLAEFATRLWKVGEDSMALDLAREAIDGLHGGGAKVTAASYQIKLSSMIRELGRLEEAERAFPAAEGLPDRVRRAWLAERSRFRLAARPQEALADSHEALLLWLAEPGAAGIETAVAKSVVARACLEAGAYEQADSLACKAFEVLRPYRHPEAASCRLTRALAVWRRARIWDRECVEEARSLIETAPLLPAAAQARVLEAEAARLERHGLSSAAHALRGMAPPWTKMAGSPAPPVPAEVVR